MPAEAVFFPRLQLALLLVAERAKGADSAWAGYLASLPERPESPLFWTPEQLALLDGTQLQQSIEGYRCSDLSMHNAHPKAGSKASARKPTVQLPRGRRGLRTLSMSP